MLMVSFASVIVSGFSDKVVAGPFTIGFTINVSAQPTLNISEPVRRNGFNEYDLQLKAGPLRGRMINVTIDDYRNSTDVSEPRLISLITDTIKSNSYRINWNKVSIGNVPGIVALVQDSESLASYSIAAYSPDGDGKAGHTIILIRSSLSEDSTDLFLRSFKVYRT
jgi:hypothetical protein